ncbi:hypothetical protein VSDG_06090 [Cytospora chrysosperma]|uniref:Cytochrome P450 n=1 Tax=Cytospora chrysosperma TaxID=252740 RepID=A0A423VWG2_CYTCH|nr:hypothetical protein VSDG_06090 [Valsa sordida]
MDITGPSWSQWLSFVLTISTTFLLIYWKWRKDPLANFPGPKLAAWTRLYSVAIVLSGKEHIYLEEAHRKYGPVIRWQPNTLLVKDSTLLPKIYHLKQNKTPHYNHSPTEIKGIVEENDWAKHREKRRRLDPTLAPKAVYRNEGLVDLHVDNWISALRKFANSNQIFDFSMWGNYLVLDIASKTFFGKDLGMVQNGRDTIGLVKSASESRHIIHAFARVPEIKAQLFFNPLFSRFFIPRPGDGTAFGHVLKVRNEMYEERLNTRHRDPDHVGLDEVLFNEANQPINHTEMKEDALFVLLGSSDTTGHALRMFVLNVSRHPECLLRLRTEIDHLFAGIQTTTGKIPALSQVKSMPYLAACIRESLRHDPPIVSYLPRWVDQEEGLEVCGRRVPPGVQIAASPYTMSRDRGLYGEDVDYFRPERFLEDPARAAKAARLDFTFGYGPRGCIGKHLSEMILAKTIVQVRYQSNDPAFIHHSIQGHRQH